MSNAVQIVPIGGLGEIGLNCMAFECEDEIIVADCGVMFSDLQMLGVDFVIPDMSYLKENKHKIAAYFITHAHEDHIGALPFALKQHPAPIYCTRFAQRLIESKLAEHNLLGSVVFHTLVPGKPVKLKHFKVDCTPVTHSIIEALALFIDTPIGKIIFTGDFKIDPSPYYGKPMDLAPFKKAGEEGVLLLMSDSTNVERQGHSLSESTLYAKLEEIFRNSQGLTILAVFASNIARVGQIVELAAKLGKKIAFMGRSMEQNTKIAFENGYLKQLNDVLISVDHISHYDRKSVIVLSTGSQGEYRSALVRVANNEHRAIKLGENDQVVMSSKFIPGNEKAIGRMINSLFKLGADVLYDSVADIHVSGHANMEELQQMLLAVKPKFFIPVHGEYRHLVRHKKLAENTNVTAGNAVLAVNGDVLELTKSSLKIVDHFEEERVFIEGEGGKDVDKLIIKDRRKVAETGIVFSIIVRNSHTGEVLGGPDLFGRGFLEVKSEADLFESAKRVVNSIVEDYQESSKKKSMDLQEEIRIGLRRYFQSRIGRKPVVMPILIDV